MGAAGPHQRPAIGDGFKSALRRFGAMDFLHPSSLIAAF
jgi:hypothetical protein